MKLTPELLAQASSALNPVKERQLDLRGYKIPAIENLGVTKDQHDAIDFTDNSLVALSNLPLLRRLHTLLLANNRISTISPSLHLSGFKYLSLLGNPVTEKKWYREWLAWRLPGLRVLDFQRIRDKERQAAKGLFLTPDGLLNALATTLSTTVSTGAAKNVTMAEEPRPAMAPGKAGRLLTKDEANKVREAITKATSVEEIRRLERSLKEGFLPSMESVGA
ncbi:L domain-like protein [Russula emetica]|nr:L domain-like protein [Russula emetica]